MTAPPLDAVSMLPSGSYVNVTAGPVGGVTDRVRPRMSVTVVWVCPLSSVTLVVKPSNALVVTLPSGAVTLIARPIESYSVVV
ncbi:MAG: hypothetical protein QY329_12705 [Anaerolineales bacterium]|nr:MAG: hypothetical protein QY329_12705 [Anaerolineales bacterium]